MRDQIAQTIEKITPFDEAERRHQKETLEWIESGAGLFRIAKPATPKMHLVSYFVPVDLERGSLMLVHHKKADLWLPPGGHVDEGEHPRVTAAREMEEELFAKAVFLRDDPLFLTVTDTVNETTSHTDVSLWYVVQGDATRKYDFDPREFHAIDWFSFDSIPEGGVEPHLARFVRKLGEVQ